MVLERPTASEPRRADRVAAVQLVEAQLLGVGEAPVEGLERVVLVEALDHAEQVVGGVLLVGQDERLKPPRCVTCQ
jgi:hypothetical protein